MHIGCGGEGNLPRYATAREGQVITRGMKKSKTEQREPSAASLKDMPEVDLSCAKLNPYVRRGITRGMTNNDAKDPAHRGETRVSPDEAVDIDDEEDK
jgi:hypothetical protein